MQIATGKDETIMTFEVETGKHRAVCAALGVSVDAPPDAMLDAMLIMTTRTKRAFFSWLSFVPAVWIDGAIDHLMARRPKK